MIWLILNILLVFAFEYVLVVLHEFGHVIAAKITGMRVLSVRLGRGRRLMKVRIFDTPVVLNAVPGIGMTKTVPNGPTYIRSRYWLVLVGGPLVHVVFLAAILVWSPESYYLGYVLPKVTSQIAPVEALLLANLLLLLFNIYPREIQHRGGKLYSDGYSLVRLPFMKRSEVDEILNAMPRIEASELIDDGSYREALEILDRELEQHPGDVYLIHDKAIAELQLGEFERSRAALLGLLDAEQFANKDARMMLQNNIAWMDAIVGDEADLERADRFSKEAFEHAPHLTIFRGTRGSVLVRLGEVDRGSLMLEKSFKECATPDNRAAEASFIALARAKQKRFDEARKWLSVAERESPSYLLNKLLAKEIDDIAQLQITTVAVGQTVGG